MNSHQIQIGAQVFNFSVVIEKDDDHPAPWAAEDGHGPVTDWTTRPKAAGELILNKDRRGGVRYYDFAAACKQALAEGWDDQATKPEGKESKRAQAARAARADFEHLQAWCNDEWQYEFITVTLLDRDGNPTTHTDSLGGTDSGYAEEQARLMCDELASQVDSSGPTSEELNLVEPTRLDVVHQQLREVHECLPDDDDTDFDVWVEEVSRSPGEWGNDLALEYLRLSNEEQHAETVAIAAQVTGDEHLAEDCTLMAKLLEASQDDNAKLKAALAVAVGTLESIFTLYSTGTEAQRVAALEHARAIVKGQRLENPPPLRWDGCHGFSIATTGQRFATIANAFKGSGEQAQEGTDLVHALARLGAVALTY